MGEESTSIDDEYDEIPEVVLDIRTVRARRARHSAAHAFTDANAKTLTRL